MSSTLKKSTNLKPINKMTRSFNNQSIFKQDSSKIIKTQNLKNNYYIQISPRLETQNLTFTNSIKKIKIIEQSDSLMETQSKSQITERDKIKKLVNKMINSSVNNQCFSQMKSSFKK